jgi:hypothetical protein
MKQEVFLFKFTFIDCARFLQIRNDGNVMKKYKIV